MKRSLSVLLVWILFLTGCGNTQPVYVPTGDGLTWDADYTGPTFTQPVEEQAQPLFLTYYPNKTMNPIQSTDYTNRALFSLLYQGLFSVDRDYQPEPLLCKSYRVSADLKKYTFYIEEGVTFSDGTPLTPEDVVASLQAAKSSKYYNGRFQYISSISLEEDKGVSLRLSVPMEQLPLLLDIPIIPQSQLDSVSPAGTGPYFIDATGFSICLRKRADWWCSADMIVTAPTITLIEAESNTQIRDNFQFSNLGLVCADPGSDRYADYRCDYELWDCENGIFLYLAFSMESEVFSNTKVRQAVTYAIDREQLADTHYRGFARGASLPASPLFPHYSDSLAAKYDYDPERFAQAVSDAGMEGKTVRLLVNKDDSLRLRVARAIAKSLTEGGLKVTLKEVDTKAYEQALLYRSYDLYLGQTRLSPNMDLSSFFHRNGALCWGGMNNVAAYTLCQQALENHGNYYTLHKTIMDDGLLCPVLFRSYAVYATRGLLTGLTPSRDNIFHYSTGKTLDNALMD